MVKYKLMYFDSNINQKENEFNLNNNGLENTQYIINIYSIKLIC